MQASAPPDALRLPAPDASAREAIEPGTSDLEDLARAVPLPWPRPIFFGLAVAGLVFHLAIADSFYGIVPRLCSGLELATLVLVAGRYACVKPPRLPWVEFIYAIHYLQFGLPTLTGALPVGIYAIIPRASSFDVAALIALFSGYALLAAFAAGLTLFRRVSGEALFPKLDRETMARGCLAHLVIASAYILVITTSPAFHARFASVVNFIDQFFRTSALVIVAGAGYLVAPRRSTLVGLLVALLVLLYGVATSSMLSDLVPSLAGLVALWWLGRRRLPVVFVASAIAIFVVAQPLKRYYREIRWSESSDTGVVDAWTQAYHNSRANQASARGSEESSALARLSEISSFAYVLDIVPASVPYSGGIAYQMIVTSLVPRVLWPDKPNMTKYGLDPIAIALGLSAPETAESSTVGMTLSAQGYSEHGVPGSLGWMALFGLSLAFFSRYFGSKVTGTMPGMIVLIPWGVASESGFMSCFGSLWQALLCGTVLSWLVWGLGRLAMRTVSPLRAR